MAIIKGINVAIAIGRSNPRAYLLCVYDKTMHTIYKCRSSSHQTLLDPRPPEEAGGWGFALCGWMEMSGPVSAGTVWEWKED